MLLCSKCGQETTVVAGPPAETIPRLGWRCSPLTVSPSSPSVPPRGAERLLLITVSNIIGARSSYKISSTKLDVSIYEHRRRLWEIELFRYQVIVVSRQYPIKVYPTKAT